MTQIAKVFKNGRSQAVRLPKEFRFQGSEVEVRRDPATGGVLLMEKRETAEQRKRTWEEFFRIVDQLDLPADFMLDRDQGVQEREDPF